MGVLKQNGLKESCWWLILEKSWIFSLFGCSNNIFFALNSLLSLWKWKWMSFQHNLGISIFPLYFHCKMTYFSPNKNRQVWVIWCDSSEWQSRFSSIWKQHHKSAVKNSLHEWSYFCASSGCSLIGEKNSLNLLPPAWRVLFVLGVQLPEFLICKGNSKICIPNICGHTGLGKEYFEHRNMRKTLRNGIKKCCLDDGLIRLGIACPG